ncbi:MAG: hypothetical protein AAF065_08595 [Verrucomicrobiota bacterium]
MNKKLTWVSGRISLCFTVLVVLVMGTGVAESKSVANTGPSLAKTKLIISDYLFRMHPEIAEDENWRRDQTAKLNQFADRMSAIRVNPFKVKVLAIRGMQRGMKGEELSKLASIYKKELNGGKSMAHLHTMFTTGYLKEKDSYHEIFRLLEKDHKAAQSEK